MALCQLHPGFGQAFSHIKTWGPKHDSYSVIYTLFERFIELVKPHLVQLQVPLDQLDRQDEETETRSVGQLPWQMGL